MKPISALAATALFILAIAEPVKAHDEPCPTFTHEQTWLLHAAYLLCKPYDWGYTCAAQVWRESFWGDEVRRENLSDGDHGSYGVTQVQPTTAHIVWGWETTPETIDIAKHILTTCDTCAIDTAVHYLMKWEHRGWHGMVKKYNGAGIDASQYATDVIGRADTLMACEPWRDY